MCWYVCACVCVCRGIGKSVVVVGVLSVLKYVCGRSGKSRYTCLSVFLCVFGRGGKSGGKVFECVDVCVEWRAGSKWGKRLSVLMYVCACMCVWWGRDIRGILFECEDVGVVKSMERRFSV